MEETKLYRKAKRLIAKAESKGYKFNEHDLGMFSALGRAEWNEEKLHWVVLDYFDMLYEKFYPKNR